ncbi:hypothetical protein, partial [Salmonella sp. s51933]|uniref:hypothetical protein n=1 Tax=Salmonella sp. s51933 TaxID=3160127 RepID=UPI0037550E42
KKEESSKETLEEPQPPQESKAEAETTSVEKKEKSRLNPNAQEFRPVKRNTPSPRSSNTHSNSGTVSPFQGHTPYGMPPYHGGGGSMYRPRPRGVRPEYIDHQNYVNASNAAGQPFFAQPMPPYLHAQPPSNIQYMPAGNLRHHGIQTTQPLFMQSIQPGQQMMLPMSSMG